MSDPDTHVTFLSAFLVNERAVGGPDPHMRIVCEGLAPMVDDPVRRAWLAGCYLAPYNVPTGEVIFNHWPSHSAVLKDEAKFERWISDSWDRFSLRRERRAIRSPRRFTIHMLSYADWIEQRVMSARHTISAEALWSDMLRIQGNGRYATIKLYETLYRMGVTKVPFPDIRPKGGWSPRQMLANIYPQYAASLNGGDSLTNQQVANDCAARLRAAMELALDTEIDWYTMEVVLCEYKQAWDGGQYPGRAHDSELGHFHKVAPLWPDVPIHTEQIRRDLFPREALGEIQGWDGRREELGGLPKQHGYMWSDLTWDYIHTTDFANPVRRAP